MFRTLCLLALFFGGGWMNALQAADPAIQYPFAARGSVVEDLHGVKVADPYRWLEMDVRKSPEVKEWVDAENKITSQFLAAIPEREGILKHLTELWDYEKYTRSVQDRRTLFLPEE